MNKFQAWFIFTSYQADVAVNSQQILHFFISLKTSWQTSVRRWLRAERKRRSGLFHFTIYSKMTLWPHSMLGAVSLFSATCDVISETSSPTLFQEFIYLGNVSWARRRPPSLIYPLPLFPSTAGVCSDWALTGGHAVCWGAGSVINLFSPNYIFPVSPGTGDSPITNLISNLCRRLVSWITFSIKLLINISRPWCICGLLESGMDDSRVSWATLL